MGQGEGQGRHRLAAPGGHREGEQPRLPLFPLGHAPLQNGAPLPVQLSLGREPARDVAPELVPQRVHGCAAVLRPGLSGHKGLRVQKVRVHQTGVQHPGEEHPCRRVPQGKGGERRGGQCHLAGPAIVWLQFPLHAAKQGGRLFAVRFPAAVRQAAVVPGHGEGGEGLLALPALHGPGSGMVDFWPALQPALESGGVFTEVVGQPGQLRLPLRAERPGKLGRQHGGPLQMGLNGLFAAIRGDVGKILHDFCVLPSGPGLAC